MTEPKSRCIFHVKNNKTFEPECMFASQTGAEPHQGCCNVSEKNKTHCNDMQYCGSHHHTYKEKETSVQSGAHQNKKGTCCKSSNPFQTNTKATKPHLKDKRFRYQKNTNNCCFKPQEQEQNLCTTKSINASHHSAKPDNCHNHCTRTQFRHNVNQYKPKSVCAHEHEMIKHTPHCHAQKYCLNHPQNHSCTTTYDHCARHNVAHHSLNNCSRNEVHHHNVPHCNNHHVPQHCIERHNPTNVEKASDQEGKAHPFGIDLSKIESILKKTEMYKIPQKDWYVKSESASMLEDEKPSTEYQSSYGKVHDTSGVVEARKRSLKMVRERNRDSFSRVQNGQTRTLPLRIKRVTYEPNSNLTISAPR